MFRLRLSSLGLLTALAVVFPCMVNAAAVQPYTSGIYRQYYQIEWCSPHADRVSWNNGSTCRTGFFQNVGGKAAISYNGQNFTVGNITPLTNISGGGGTRTSGNINNIGGAVVNLFTTNTNFVIDGEGVFKIHMYIIDGANNAIYQTVSYKIDKTAPKLRADAVGTSGSYAYADGQVNQSFTVTKNDSVSDSSNGEEYTAPPINAYQSTTASARTSHVRPLLYTLYFRDTTSGAGASAPFTVSSSYSDTFDGYLKNSSSLGNLVSGEQKFMLLSSDGVPLVDNIGVSGTTNLDTSKLFSSYNENTQKTYRLRLYDNTYGPGGSAGNYSELAFYAVRDNTPPNMWGNGGSATARSALETLLTFNDDVTVYDNTISNSIYSRFIAATSSMPIKYRVTDTGITGNGVATSGTTGCTSYELCNAGLLFGSQIRMEDPNNANAMTTFLDLPSRFVNTGTQSRSFSRVDNDRNAGNYRLYKTDATNPSGSNQLCDLVGNCITPDVYFRVVASTVDQSASTFSLLANSFSTVAAGVTKPLANGNDNYLVSYTLKDAYGNTVVPVKSLENSGTPLIKDVNTTVTLANGMNADQRSTTPTGARLVSIANQDTADTASFTADNTSINASSTPSFTYKESVTANPNGTFSFTLGSKVPTKGMYPYLASSSILDITSLGYSAPDSLGTPSAITYPASGSRLGYMSSTTVAAGATSPFVTPNTGAIGVSGTNEDFTVNPDDYGKVVFSNNVNRTLTDITGRRINLEFAPRLLYGVSGYRFLTDGQFSTHYERAYPIDPSITPLEYNVYTKNLVAYTGSTDEQPDVLTYTMRTPPGIAGSSTDVSSGVRLSSIAANGTFFGIGQNVLHGLDVLATSGSGTAVEFGMNTIPGRVYDTARLRYAFVSGLAYTAGGSSVQLPGFARKILSSANATLDHFTQARTYFSGLYSLGVVGVSTPLTPPSGVSDIAVVGSTSNGQTQLTNAAQSSNVVINENLRRSGVLATVKKNIAEASAGIGTVDSSQTRRWCDGRSSPVVIDQNFLDSTSTCTFDVAGERLSFIQGNATVNCGTTCAVDSKRAIVIMSGSLNIQSNISTRDTMGADTPNGQLFFAVLAANGLSTLTVDTTTAPNITASDKAGWAFVDPNITNIDAFLFAQGPIVSYSTDAITGQKYYSFSRVQDTDLRNQLYIYGSIFSLNTVGGSRKTPAECPYIVANCNSLNTDGTAQVFDLTYLRRYMLADKSYVMSDPLLSGQVPYYPGALIAKRAGGLTDTNTTCNNASRLRCVTNAAYQGTPTLVERDPKWDRSPSNLFKATAE